jgi:hypothetical protein
VSAASGRQPQQTVAEPRLAALRERVRAAVATWPPLSAWQRDRLRVLLDLSDGGDRADLPHPGDYRPEDGQHER